MFNLKGLLDGAALDEAEFRAAVVELCERGLLTCTRGQPGDADAAYAVAWAPLDNPAQHSADVRERHAENLRRFNAKGAGQKLRIVDGGA